MMAHLQVDSLSKVYESQENDLIAVDDLSFGLEQGEFLVLVGPSGCGKSTTLECIAGLEDATDGEIYIDGEQVNDLSPEERNIAMVFQNYALYPHMTARENMAFGLKMSTNLSGEEISRRIDEAAEMMGIEELLNDRPKELSGGQQQRVALGRAMVREPEVFLLDEPLSNLDAKLRNKMRTEIKQLQRNIDVTTIYVTHDQTEAMTMGDRIAVLNDGELQQLGTPLECYHKPSNIFVAGFIGEPSMNFFTMKKDNGMLRNNAFDYPISDDLEQELSGFEDIVLGIRPEDLQIAETSSSHSVTGTVDVVHPQGDVNEIIVDIDDESVNLVTDGEVMFEEHDDVELEFPEKRLHIFDESTGEAIRNRIVSDESQFPTIHNQDI